MPKAADIPLCPNLPPHRGIGRSSREYQIRLMTPMFGGGAVAGEPDPTYPLRGTAIRGQLQFWWRATRGALCADRNELFERHAEIWGTTEKASSVEVEIRSATISKSTPCAKYEWNPQARKGKGSWDLNWVIPFQNTWLPYLLFPYQGRGPFAQRGNPEKNPAHFIEKASFTLLIRFPESLREEVETSVWAWINFGGLGARTRRGCGALYCQELAARDSSSLRDWFRAAAGVSPEQMRIWPTIPDQFLIHSKADESVNVWNELIKFYRNFRQGEGLGRNPKGNQNRPGRSRYPEPETIRRITGNRSSEHQRIHRIPDDSFPRAEFGLPIVFKFQSNQDEPPLTVLYPSNGPNNEKRERMASPLIIKPLLLADGKAIRLIMRLNVPRLTGVDLRDGEQSLDLPPNTVIQDKRLALDNLSPLANTSSGSALDAFIALARRSDHGFEEVVR